MDFNEDLKLAIGWNRLNLEMIGVWPEPMSSNDGFAKYKCFVISAFLTYGIVAPQMVNLFFIWGELDRVTENLSTANIPATNAVLKLLFIRYHQEALKPLVKSFYDDWKNEKTKEERKTMLEYATIGRNISIWCSVLTQTMVTLFLSLRSVQVTKSDKNTEDQDHLLLYPGYVPYSLQSTPALILSNLTQIGAAYIATIAYTGVDSFIAMIILHTCGQFTNLRRKLARLMDFESRTKDKGVILKKMAFIVKRHEHLDWVATKIEDSFNMLLLIQMLLVTTEICFQGFMFFKMLIENKDDISGVQLLFFILFVVFIVAHVYIYCYVGELLLVQSSGMANSAYESNWFNMQPSDTKCLLFIMHKSVRPLRLTAGKFSTFSMEMFSNILRTSVGYLSVLVTVTSTD